MERAFKEATRDYIGYLTEGNHARGIPEVESTTGHIRNAISGQALELAASHMHTCIAWHPRIRLHPAITPLQLLLILAPRGSLLHTSRMPCIEGGRPAPGTSQ